MVYMPKKKLALFLATVSLSILLAACDMSADITAARRDASNCVPLPEGEYMFQNGVFTPTGLRVVNTIETRVQGSEDDGAQLLEPVINDPEWVDVISAQFPDMGFDWLDLTVRGRSAILTGAAPDSATKEAAFAAGQSAVLASPSASDRIRVVVDGTSIDGLETGLAEALLDLRDGPDLPACQSTFAATMENRDVAFRTGSSVIQPESTRLLDTIAAIALMCRSHDIEVGGHTDDIGENLENLRLSQRRADAVRTFLIERGVRDRSITSIGYGETRPLDDSGTLEARSKNRRTEFTVRRRR
ncbi:MAG: OmpA family protein [Pseudomonadota bacterium]